MVIECSADGTARTDWTFRTDGTTADATLKFRGNGDVEINRGGLAIARGATPFTPILISPDAPGQIRDLKAVPGDSKVTLSWTAPSDKGSSITQYRITQIKANSDSFKTMEYSGTTKSAVITGLQNDVTYNFKIQGKNVVGLGPESNTVSVIPQSSLPQPILPAWIKTTAQWWAEGKISNLEYTKAIEWLINEGIIKLK